VTGRLNAGQSGSVLASFRHLDNLLVEAVRILREAGGGAPFSQHVPDAAPDQVERMEEAVEHFQQTLLKVLDDWQVERPATGISALHAARVNVLYADLALEDLRPRGLKSYGAVAEETAAALDEAVDELRELLHQMTEILG